MSEKTITISLARYKQLLKDQEWLNCLEEAGVENWNGIEQTIEIYRKIEAELKLKLSRI